MIRAALLSLTFVACAAAQTVAHEGGSTAAMLSELGRLEPEGGWTARPTGVAEVQWSYYRRAFGMAPDGNEPNATRVGLGQLLFFDKRLSRDRTRSCASCHDPLHGFAEPRPTSRCPLRKEVECRACSSSRRKTRAFKGVALSASTLISSGRLQPYCCMGSSTSSEQR